MLLVSAAGVLGGAERVLLDWARALEPPVVLACPPGPLAAAARTAGIEVATLAERPLQRRGRSARAAVDLAALGRDIAALCRSRRPGGRRRVGPAAAARGRVGAAVRRAGCSRCSTTCPRRPPPRGCCARRHGAARRRSPLRGRADVTGAGARDPPRRRPRRVVAPRAARPAAARAVPRRARAGQAPGPRARDRGAGAGAAARPRGRAAAGRPARARRRAAASGRPAPTSPAASASSARSTTRGRRSPSRTVLLHCAEREAFGIALVEALAAGRPVVAPAAGGPLEIVTPACGRLYEPGDAEAAAAAIVDVLGDPDAPAAARERAAAFDARDSARAFAAAVDATSVV